MEELEKTCKKFADVLTELLDHEQSWNERFNVLQNHCNDEDLEELYSWLASIYE